MENGYRIPIAQSLILLPMFHEYSSAFLPPSMLERPILDLPVSYAAGTWTCDLGTVNHCLGASDTK